MASKIEPGAPKAPQNRKQIMTEEGGYVPVQEEEQIPAPKQPDAIELDQFIIGDSVELIGKVIDVAHIQGPYQKVKVQLPNGAAWFRNDNLAKKPVASVTEDVKTEELSTVVIDPEEVV